MTCEEGAFEAELNIINIHIVKNKTMPFYNTLN